MTVPPVIPISPGQVACRKGDHQEGNDPRMAGRCIRCGKELPPETGPRRDPKFECEITRYLLSGMNVDPDPLNAYAGRRADDGKAAYGYDFPSLERNFAVEGADEAADGRNYMCWWLDAFNRGLIPDSEHWKAEHFQQALKHFALAFNECYQAMS